VPLTPPPTAQGSYVSFKGQSAQQLLSIKYSRTRGRIDITGLDSPAYEREIVPGDMEPATIAISTFTYPGNLFYFDNEPGELTISLNGVWSYTFTSAFLESTDVDAASGEYIKASYTFVASA
jgi:hypothetical protein